jgi:hypothetical protein
VDVAKDNHDLEHTIMSDKRAWTKAIHLYKTVVKRYVACNMDLWLLFFVYDMYDLPQFNGVFELRSSRGGIYVHVIGYLLSQANVTIDASLANWDEKA